MGLNPKLAGKGIVNANKEGLRSQRDWSAGRPTIVQEACLKVERLCGPQGGLEVHNVLYLRRRGNCTLRMPGRGGYRLVSQVCQQLSGIGVGDLLRARRRGLAPIPHERAEETQVCRRKWTAVHRKRGRITASIRVVDAFHAELGTVRHGQGNANQAPAEQQAVGLAPPLHG